MAKPAHPCGQPGCPVLVHGRPHCPEHTVERKRDPEQARFYGSSRWQKLRAMVRRQQPLCQMCRNAPSAVVDHIDGNWRNNRMDNLRGLCSPCERSHTGRQHQKKRGR